MTNILLIFTDGSCSKTHCGIGIFFPNNEYKNVSQKFPLENPTNQRAELYAIYEALNIIKNDKYDKVIIYSDSVYSINSVTKWIINWKQNNWKTANKQDVKNKDIIIKIDELIKPNIEFKHIKEHTNLQDYFSLCNDKADKLAKCEK